VKKFLSALFLTLAVTGNAFAADIKIGVVSVERILTEAPQVDAVNTSMLERFGPKRDELEGMAKEIRKLEENYKRNELVMTEDKLNELKNQIISKVQELKAKEAAMAQEVAGVRSQELAMLQKQVTGIIEDVAKKEGFDLVLSEGIAYTSDKLDITDKVLDKMKAAHKKK